MSEASLPKTPSRKARREVAALEFEEERGKEIDDPPPSKPDLLEALLEHCLQPVLLVLLAAHPEGVLVLHDVGEHRPPQEDHVLAPRGIFDTQLEPVQLPDVALGHVTQVERADLLRVPGGRKRGVGGSSGAEGG
eukprot:scaffold18104_cov114-Isochrysis_galbana.AAC.2